MRFLKSKRFIHIILTVTALAVVTASVSYAAGTEPGSAEDPVVSQSYVDAKISELNSQISSLNNQVSSLAEQVRSNTGSTGGTSQGAKFQIIGPVAAGKKIIAGESTEIVLRGGKATALASQYGGVADLITGTDLQTGAEIPLNHLLLVPRDDGRGITITSEAWVMVRGSYTIQ